MSKANFEELFNKFLEESMTAEELARFKVLFDDEQYAALREEMLEAAFQRREFIESGDYDLQMVFQELLTRIQEQEAVEAETPVVPIYRRSARLGRRIAAAAVIFLVLSGTGYLILHRKTGPDALAGPTQRYANDALPGGNKAALILDNGSTIVLDSAHTGALALQGNAQIVKTDSGRLAYTILNEKPNAVLFNTLRTPRGGQYQLVLPDGSTVWLNAASSIRYPVYFSGKDREVEVSGEVYVEVAKDATRPFRVKIGDEAVVEVLGTEFNINAYTDEGAVKTTLLEGSVRVVAGKDNLKGPVLKPGQQAKIAPGSIQVISGIDVEEVVAWKNCRFEFDHTDVPTIMRQISRWYDVDVDYEADYSGSKFSGGINRSLNLSVVLRMLDKDGIHSRLENGKVILIH
jgi:transmembrane sensor